MPYTDQWTRSYEDERFQKAFQRYFHELGVQVTNWEGLFAQMADDDEPMIVRTDAHGSVIGFILFSTFSMSSPFFQEQCGFVQEFWVAPEMRGQGHGSALLETVERWFQEQGVFRWMLTTDTAASFYLHRGYRMARNMVAKNQAPVYTKSAI